VLGMAWFHLPDIKLRNWSLGAIVLSSLNPGAKHEDARKYEQCVCISAGNNTDSVSAILQEILRVVRL
jgi:hypothetical protein